MLFNFHLPKLGRPRRWLSAVPGSAFPFRGRIFILQRHRSFLLEIHRCVLNCLKRYLGSAFDGYSYTFIFIIYPSILFILKPEMSFNKFDSYSYKIIITKTLNQNDGNSESVAGNFKPLLHNAKLGRWQHSLYFIKILNSRIRFSFFKLNIFKKLAVNSHDFLRAAYSKPS